MKKINGDNKNYRYVCILYKMNQDLQKQDLYEDFDDTAIFFFEKQFEAKISNLSNDIK